MTLLSQIEQRVKEATPGKWERDTCSVICCLTEPSIGTRKHSGGGFYGVICDTGDFDDCRSLNFIAHSRTDVEALLRLARATKNYIDYMDSDALETNGGKIRREYIRAALAELTKEVKE